MQSPILFERIEIAIHKLETRNAKIKPIIEEYTKKLESKKEPIIEYRPPFLNGLELDAFSELHWRCKGLSIGFIALAGIKMSKNSRTSLIVIGKNDAFVKIMKFSFLKYGMTKNQKSLFLIGYKKLRSLFV